MVTRRSNTDDVHGLHILARGLRKMCFPPFGAVRLHRLLVPRLAFGLEERNQRPFLNFWVETREMNPPFSLYRQSRAHVLPFTFISAG